MSEMASIELERLLCALEQSLLQNSDGFCSSSAKTNEIESFAANLSISQIANLFVIKQQTRVTTLTPAQEQATKFLAFSLFDLPQWSGLEIIIDDEGPNFAVAFITQLLLNGGSSQDTKFTRKLFMEVMKVPATKLTAVLREVREESAVYPMLVRRMSRVVADTVQERAGKEDQMLQTVLIRIDELSRQYWNDFASGLDILQAVYHATAGQLLEGSSKADIAQLLSRSHRSHSHIAVKHALVQRLSPFNAGLLPFRKIYKSGKQAEHPVICLNDMPSIVPRTLWLQFNDDVFRRLLYKNTNDRVSLTFFGCILFSLVINTEASAFQMDSKGDARLTESTQWLVSPSVYLQSSSWFMSTRCCALVLGSERVPQLSLDLQEVLLASSVALGQLFGNHLPSANKRRKLDSSQSPSCQQQIENSPPLLPPLLLDSTVADAIPSLFQLTSHRWMALGLGFLWLSLSQSDLHLAQVLLSQPPDSQNWTQTFLECSQTSLLRTLQSLGVTQVASSVWKLNTLQAANDTTIENQRECIDSPGFSLFNAFVWLVWHYGQLLDAAGDVETTKHSNQSTFELGEMLERIVLLYKEAEREMSALPQPSKDELLSLQRCWELYLMKAVNELLSLLSKLLTKKPATSLGGGEWDVQTRLRIWVSAIDLLLVRNRLASRWFDVNDGANTRDTVTALLDVDVTLSALLSGLHAPNPQQSSSSFLPLFAMKKSFQPLLSPEYNMWALLGGMLKSCHREETLCRIAVAVSEWLEEDPMPPLLRASLECDKSVIDAFTSAICHLFVSKAQIAKDPSHRRAITVLLKSIGCMGYHTNLCSSVLRFRPSVISAALRALQLHSSTAISVNAVALFAVFAENCTETAASELLLAQVLDAGAIPVLARLMETMRPGKAAAAAHQPQHLVAFHTELVGTCHSLLRQEQTLHDTNPHGPHRQKLCRAFLCHQRQLVDGFTYYCTDEAMKEALSYDIESFVKILEMATIFCCSSADFQRALSSNMLLNSSIINMATHIVSMLHQEAAQQTALEPLRLIINSYTDFIDSIDLLALCRQKDAREGMSRFLAANKSFTFPEMARERQRLADLDRNLYHNR